jgi:hypothetical protein
MAADFKSHVLSRDEKGLFGIPFKRLLLAGVCGGLTYTLLNLTLPNVALAGGVTATLLLVILTGPRGGLPLWQRFLYRLRGSLLLASARQPHGIWGQVATILELPLELVWLDASKVFAPPASQMSVDLREWVTFAQARDADADDGLAFVESPLSGERL